MQHYERLLSRLDNVSKHGNGHRARCPGHEDNNPSLDITIGADGHIRLKCCSAGCSTAVILQSINLTPDDLYPDLDEEIIYADDQTLFDLSGGGASTDYATLSEADIEQRSSVYSKFLQLLVLSEQHRDNLLQRGLHECDIDKRGYRSLTFKSSRDALAELRTTFADTDLLSTPGFVPDDNGGGRMAGPKQGMIIPSRDPLGRIASLKVRRDGDHEGYSKYSCISGGGGPSCGTPTHVPLGIQVPVSVVRVTEGERVVAGNQVRLRVGLEPALVVLPFQLLEQTKRRFRNLCTHRQSLTFRQFLFGLTNKFDQLGTYGSAVITGSKGFELCRQLSRCASKPTLLIDKCERRRNHALAFAPVLDVITIPSQPSEYASQNPSWPWNQSVVCDTDSCTPRQSESTHSEVAHLASEFWLTFRRELTATFSGMVQFQNGNQSLLLR